MQLFFPLLLELIPSWILFNIWGIFSSTANSISLRPLSPLVSNYFVHVWLAFLSSYPLYHTINDEFFQFWEVTWLDIGVIMVFPFKHERFFTLILDINIPYLYYNFYTFLATCWVRFLNSFWKFLAHHSLEVCWRFLSNFMLTFPNFGIGDHFRLLLEICHFLHATWGASSLIGLSRMMSQRGWITSVRPNC